MANTSNQNEATLSNDYVKSEMPRIWKISHGKHGRNISDDDNKKLLENCYVGVGWADKPDHLQRRHFLAINSSDYFYLVKDASIILLGKLTDDEQLTVNDDIKIIISEKDTIQLTNEAMRGWIFRKFNRIDDPKIEPHKVKIINKNGGMPSSNSTVQEIKTPEYLKSFENDVLKPIFGKELSDLGIILPPLINSDKPSMRPTQRGIEMSSLNQILFGPPGTGKTYNTVSEALKIFNFIAPDYSNLKTQFDNLKSEGRIEFVTFHQSFSYEDFVEGIRAETNDNGELSYSIKDGVFKKIAIEALFSKFEEEFTEQLDELWEEAKSKNRYQNKITADTKYDRNNYDHKKLILSACKIGHYTVGTGEKYVLIIDEINRGNTSRVFGELITLIETTKRAGTDEAMDAILPYSQETFTIPDNLYIIGTMNTADRSLALMDTVLRRRFDFIEMMPKPGLIKDINIEGIDLELMLQTINDRIEGLYDREHTIGHAFFMKLKDEPTVEKLASIFRNNILPLLEEYFFEDWEKIINVLGSSKIYQENEKLTQSQLGFEPSGKSYKRNDVLLNKDTYINIYSSRLNNTNQVEPE